MFYKCVKFHKNPISRLGGVALTRYMDGRTDRVIPLYPPNFVCGGYNNQNQTNTTGAQNLKEFNNTAGWLSVFFGGLFVMN